MRATFAVTPGNPEQETPRKIAIPPRPRCSELAPVGCSFRTVFGQSCHGRWGRQADFFAQLLSQTPVAIEATGTRWPIGRPVAGGPRPPWRSRTPARTPPAQSFLNGTPLDLD